MAAAGMTIENNTQMFHYTVISSLRQEHWMTPKWHWMLKCQRYPIVVRGTRLLHGGVHSVHAAEANSGSTLLLSIPDKPPETRLSCPQKRAFSCGATLAVLLIVFAWQEGRGRCLDAFVHCLGGLARRVDNCTTSPLSSLPDRVSLDCLSWACQNCTPQRSSASQWFISSIASQSLSLSLFNFLQQGPRVLASASPIGHPRP